MASILENNSNNGLDQDFIKNKKFQLLNKYKDIDNNDEIFKSVIPKKEYTQLMDEHSILKTRTPFNEKFIQTFDSYIVLWTTNSENLDILNNLFKLLKFEFLLDEKKKISFTDDIVNTSVFKNRIDIFDEIDNIQQSKIYYRLFEDQNTVNIYWTDNINDSIHVDNKYNEEVNNRSKQILREEKIIQFLLILGFEDNFSTNSNEILTFTYDDKEMKFRYIKIDDLVTLNNVSLDSIESFYNFFSNDFEFPLSNINMINYISKNFVEKIYIDFLILLLDYIDENQNIKIDDNDKIDYNNIRYISDTFNKIFRNDKETKYEHLSEIVSEILDNTNFIIEAGKGKKKSDYIRQLKKTSSNLYLYFKNNLFEYASFLDDAMYNFETYFDKLIDFYMSDSDIDFKYYENSDLSLINEWEVSPNSQGSIQVPINCKYWCNNGDCQAIISGKKCIYLHPLNLKAVNPDELFELSPLLVLNDNYVQTIDDVKNSNLSSTNYKPTYFDSKLSPLLKRKIDTYLYSKGVKYYTSKNNYINWNRWNNTRGDEYEVEIYNVSIDTTDEVDTDEVDTNEVDTNEVDTNEADTTEEVDTNEADTDEVDTNEADTDEVDTSKEVDITEVDTNEVDTSEEVDTNEIDKFYDNFQSSSSVNRNVNESIDTTFDDSSSTYSDNNKKAFCKYFKSGNCIKDDCPYSHTKLPCKYFMRGICDKTDEECMYSHDQYVRDSNHVNTSTVIQKDKIFCKDFRDGKCYKKNCPYSHVKKLCENFVKGECLFGNRCFYSHKIPHVDVKQDKNIIFANSFQKVKKGISYAKIASSKPVPLISSSRVSSSPISPIPISSNSGSSSTSSTISSNSVSSSPISSNRVYSSPISSSRVSSSTLSPRPISSNSVSSNTLVSNDYIKSLYEEFLKCNRYMERNDNSYTLFLKVLKLKKIL